MPSSSCATELQQVMQSLEEGPSEHISFDRVEKLAAQEEEVIGEVSKVQYMVKGFQDKVGPTAQHGPALEA